jgi:hypothetical protein
MDSQSQTSTPETQKFRSSCELPARGPTTNQRCGRHVPREGTGPGRVAQTVLRRRLFAEPQPRGGRPGVPLSLVDSPAPIARRYQLSTLPCPKASRRGSPAPMHRKPLTWSHGSPGRVACYRSRRKRRRAGAPSGARGGGRSEAVSGTTVANAWDASGLLADASAEKAGPRRDPPPFRPLVRLLTASSCGPRARRPRVSRRRPAPGA